MQPFHARGLGQKIVGPSYDIVRLVDDKGHVTLIPSFHEERLIDNTYGAYESQRGTLWDIGSQRPFGLKPPTFMLAFYGCKNWQIETNDGTFNTKDFKPALPLLSADEPSSYVISWSFGDADPDGQWEVRLDLTVGLVFDKKRFWPHVFFGGDVSDDGDGQITFFGESAGFTGLDSQGNPNTVTISPGDPRT